MEPPSSAYQPAANEAIIESPTDPPDAEKDSASPEPKSVSILEAIGPDYARKRSFWSGLCFSATLQGIILGLVALTFFVAFEGLEIATWNTSVYQDALGLPPGSDEIHAVLGLGNGQWWYVGLLAAGGATVGSVKALWTRMFRSHPFPVRPAGFLKDINDLKAEDPWHALPILGCSILSIGCGASCGPELPLGAAGVSFGGSAVPAFSRWLGKALPSCVSHFLDLSGQQRECALDGMAASFGALFPSQFLSPMLLLELGKKHWGPGEQSLDMMETIARTGIASTVAYAVFVGLKDQTLLDTLPPPQAAYDSISTINVVYLLDGAVLGIICGFVGLFGFVLLVAGILLGDAVCHRIDRLGVGVFEVREENDDGDSTPRRTYLGMIATPAIGGSLVGLLAVACPLILGDGSLQLKPVLTNAETLGVDTLITTAIAKLAALALSLGFGFIGGPIFPFLLTGSLIGSAANVLVPNVPLLIAYPACLVATPCAFVPALFTFTSLASVMLALGGPATAPAFVAAVCSFTVVCGGGILQGMVSRALARKARKEAETSNASS